MYKRKKRTIDGIDKEILRILFYKRPLVTLKISGHIGLGTSSTSSRLMNLREMGFTKISKTCKIRNYKIHYKNKILDIKSSRATFWDLDLIDDKQLGGFN